MEMIYFLRPVGMDGPVKIGCSTFPESRFADMMRWSPLPLELVATVQGSFPIEAAIHAFLAGAHSHGEWFHPTVEVLRVVELAQKGELPALAYGPVQRWPKFSPARRSRFAAQVRYRAAQKRAGISRQRGADPEVEAVFLQWRVSGKQPQPNELAFIDSRIALLRSLDGLGRTGPEHGAALAIEEAARASFARAPKSSPDDGGQVDA